MPSSADFNYSHAPDVSDPVSMVRFLVGDVDSNNPILTDSEILAITNIQPVITYAAAAAADIIAARYAVQIDTTIGRTKVSLSQRFEHFKSLADRLRESAGDLPGGDGTGQPTVGMFVGGISISEEKALADDADRIQPSFSIGMNDNPGTYPDENDDRYGCD